jgi:hypothetical protein
LPSVQNTEGYKKPNEELALHTDTLAKLQVTNGNPNKVASINIMTEFETCFVRSDCICHNTILI